MQRVIEAELGFIAAICPDGTPNLSPKGRRRCGTTAIWCSPACARRGTVENLRSNAGIETGSVS
jgi:uncharacterized protein